MVFRFFIHFEFKKIKLFEFNRKILLIVRFIMVILLKSMNFKSEVPPVSLLSFIVRDFNKQFENLSKKIKLIEAKRDVEMTDLVLL